MGQKELKKQCQKTKQKKVKEIFSDYETKTNIKEAYLTALNVIKKTNTLGIVLEINELCRRHLYNLERRYNI